MLSVVAYALLLLLSCPPWLAAGLKVVEMPVKHNRRSLAGGLQKRDPQAVDLTLSQNLVMYTVNASVGNPLQMVQLDIDTGSSDVWMLGPQLSDCKTCSGIYDPSKSSTSSMIKQGGFKISYEDQSGASGDLIGDDFVLGDLHIKNLTMAVANDGQGITTGVMGIGFDTNEATIDPTHPASKPYRSVIDTMVDQGLINIKAYSLYLDDLEAGTGSVLFGGYDAAKYEDYLTFFPIMPDAQSKQMTSMTVAATQMAVAYPDGTTIALDTKPFPLAAVLDSGTTTTVLPSSIFDQLVQVFNAVNDDDSGWLANCSIGQSESWVSYQFEGNEGVAIYVPFSELNQQPW